MKIVIETIPHAEQRYETVGDWYYEPDGTLHIRVSELGDDRYNFLVALHELVEQELCKDRGITQDVVDAFDKKYEEQRVPGDDSEPGDNPVAPYAAEHCAATGVERLLASLLNVSWKTYDDKIMSL